MEVGFFGKLPSHGDFVRRRVADDFVAGWDAWLQSCLAQSRETLGDEWLDTYLTSPVWRFALAPAHTVFVDDRADNIAAARARGWHGIVHADHAGTLRALRELGVAC